MNLKQFREQYPQYNDMADEQLVDALHKKYYSDMPRQEFAEKFGAFAPEPRRAGRAERAAEGFIRGVQGPQEGLSQLVNAAIGNTKGRDYWINETKRKDADHLQNVRGGQDDFDWSRAAGGIVAPLMMSGGIPAAANLPARMALSGAGGVFQGLMQPVSESEKFAEQKTKQGV